jgi:hypothetical protein
MIERSTCHICNAKTERRVLPSGVTTASPGIKRVVSYWCPQCRQWASSDEAVSDTA